MSQTDSSSQTDWALLFSAWAFSAFAALGSIFFSHVMGFAPCLLCWYQRIFLFPLALILAVGLFPFDRKAARYGLALAIPGWFVALYHNLLYSGIIPQELQPCSSGVSCTEKYIDLFGFITIPMLSLMTFTILIAVLIILIKRGK